MDDSFKILEKKALYWLIQIPGLGIPTIRNLWEQYHSFVRLYNIEETELPAEQRELIGQWLSHRNECDLHYEEMLQRGIRFVTILDEEYPESLRALYDYPLALYIKGHLPDPKLPAIAIVGARSCSAYGKQTAEFFGRTLAAEGIQVISGLALGIDGAAHRGAIAAKQPTYAVLGCGVNICYPARNYQIYEGILPDGGIISEYGLDTEPRPHLFPLRNRIISALSDAVLVVEAKSRSGSLITAEFGLEQGKEIFAIPGRITDPLSEGCNQLIRQGADLIISPEDIMEFFSIKRQKTLILCEKNINRLAKREKMVYSCLDFQPKHLDEIANDCNLSIPECLEVLLTLEISGFVIQTTNYYYAKKM